MKKTKLDPVSLESAISSPASQATNKRLPAWSMSMPCAPKLDNGQCCTFERSGRLATSTIEGSRTARKTRDSCSSITHQRGRPGNLSM